MRWKCELATVALPALTLGFAYAVVVYEFRIFPYHQIKDAQATADYLLRAGGARENSDRYYPTLRTQAVSVRLIEAMSPGLTLVSGVSTQKEASLVARVVDDQGVPVYEWKIDPFEVWKNFDHVAPMDRPKERPGTLIHGILLLANGDLLFSLTRIGLTRMDPCGNVVWQLPQNTHHSLYQDGEKNFWTCGKTFHTSPSPKFPGYTPPFIDETILKVSPSGKILDEVSVSELLENNGLSGLLFMRGNQRKDPLHLNHVEPFPDNLTPGIFKKGDVVISLRELNTVVVFQMSDRKITFRSVGQVQRQHNPHFVDGYTLSVFDNNTPPIGVRRKYSRIVRLLADGSTKTIFEGNTENPFYTAEKGKHQILPNGNMLITEAESGRIFEVDRDNRVVWDFVNLVENQRVGMIDEGQRLGKEFDRSFFQKLRERCRVKPDLQQE